MAPKIIFMMRYLQKVVFVTLSEAKGLDSSVAALPQNDRNLEAFARGSDVKFFKLGISVEARYFLLKEQVVMTNE